MKHIRRLLSIKKNNHTHSSKKSLSTVLVLFLPIFLVSTFILTKGSAPHTSELAYVEHSILGKKAGSVVPASCDSLPPSSHFLGDCTTACPADSIGGAYDPYLGSLADCLKSCPDGSLTPYTSTCPAVPPPPPTPTPAVCVSFTGSCP